MQRFLWLVLIATLTIGLINSYGAPTDPPLSVQRYLSDRNILISSSEVAVENVDVRTKKIYDDTPALLKAYGLEVGRKMGQGVTLIHTDRSDPIAVKDVSVQLGADTAPVLKSQGSALRVVPLRTVVFRLLDDVSLDAVKSTLSAMSAGEPRWLREQQYATELGIDAGHWSSLELSAALSEIDGIDWAVPDCVREVRKNFMPNDITNQWHLHNTNNVTWTNSSALTEAWSTTLGDPSIIIAIVDDGVQVGHPDLIDNIWLNPGEVPGDLADNDSNGYVDDRTGWDFYKGTNIVTPVHEDENHGTAVAGVAAARGNNGMGVSGAAPYCKILPVKIFFGNEFVTDLQWADAVDYAARYADVMNLSIGTTGILSNQLVNAFNRASTSTIIFASSANDADKGLYYYSDCTADALIGWYPDTQVFGAGTHTCRWEYVKDTSESVGRDSCWIDSVTLPNGQKYDFESGVLSNNWSTGGDAPWFFSPESTDSMANGKYSLRSGPITHSQSTWVEVVFTGPGNFTHYYQAMGERYCSSGTLQVWDYMTIYTNGTVAVGDESTVEDINDASYGTGQQDLTLTQFPAALTAVVAVGASDISGYRAAYSCFDTNLEITAPSGGATDQTGIRTTDRTGTDGYNTSGNYDDNFSGTSSASPLAAGIAALIWSVNPTITPHELRQVIRMSGRKIGDVPYIGGRNDRYGYGQIDAAAGVGLALSNMPPKIVRFEDDGNRFRLAAMGIEDARQYTVYGASALNAAGEWQWSTITSPSGSPTFGTNWTPYIEWTSNPPYRVYKIEK